jgi:predicted MPP superfamily phosphohydrolase
VELKFIVSRGTGTTGAPIRLNVSPEITLFRLT